MLTKLGAHFKANAIGYLALLVALSGTAWAAASIGSSQVIDNSLRSVDLKDDAAVKSADVVDDTQPNGGLRSTDLAADEVRAEDIAEDAVGFSELAAGAFNADIAEQGGVFGIPNDGIQGFEVEDGTLGGNDVDESTLTGVVKGRGEAFCCSIRGGSFTPKFLTTPETQRPFSIWGTSICAAPRRAIPTGSISATHPAV